MKKNPGRKERRRLARLNRKEEGRKRAKHNNQQARKGGSTVSKDLYSKGRAV